MFQTARLNADLSGRSARFSRSRRPSPSEELRVSGFSMGMGRGCLQSQGDEAGARPLPLYCGKTCC